MQSRVINFTKQTTTGNQSITGVGFTPLAYIMFSTDAVRGDGNASAGAHQSIGISDGSTSNAKAYHMDNRTSTTKVAEYSDNAIFLRINSSATILAKAVHNGFTSDGCTINWSTNDSSTFLITVIFFGGSDLVDANVGNFGIQQTTGAQTISTGIGATPQFVFVIPHGVTALGSGFSDGGDVCWGAASGSGNQFSIALNSTNTGASAESSNTWQDTSNFITRLDKNVNTATIDYQASFTGFTSNGFTINVNTATTYGTNRLVSYLLLTGAAATCKFKVINVNKSISIGNQAITGAGFAPLSTLFGFTQQTTTNAGVSSGTLDVSIGAGDSSIVGTQVFSQIHGSQSTNCDFVAISDVIAGMTATTNANLSSITNLASLTSLDSDGCTIHWDTNDGKAENMCIVFFGITGGASGGGASATNVVTQGACFS